MVIKLTEKQKITVMNSDDLYGVMRQMIQKATRFVLLLERGQGDSVEEIAQYWGDRSINEIHHQVMMWKTQQPPQ